MRAWTLFDQLDITRFRHQGGGTPPVREEGPGPVTTLLQRRDHAEIENHVLARGVPTPLCMVRPLTYKALSTQLGNQLLVRRRET